MNAVFSDKIFCAICSDLCALSSGWEIHCYGFIIICHTLHSLIPEVRVGKNRNIGISDSVIMLSLENAAFPLRREYKGIERERKKYQTTEES